VNGEDPIRTGSTGEIARLNSQASYERKGEHGHSGRKGALAGRTVKGKKKVTAQVHKGKPFNGQSTESEGVFRVYRGRKSAVDNRSAKKKDKFSIAKTAKAQGPPQSCALQVSMIDAFREEVSVT